VDTEQAQREIFRLYNTEWMKVSGGLDARDEVVGALPFFNWLQKNHPETLTFPCDGDRYQEVKLWVGLP
jgi:hypothetical protein